MTAIADFRTRLPEFDGVDDSLISAALADAALEIAPLKWGAFSVSGVQNLADLGQIYLAAANLAISPWGQNARMAVKVAGGQWSSVYETRYRRLQRYVTMGYRTA